MSSNASTFSVESETEEQELKPIVQSLPLPCSDSEFSTKMCRVIVKGVCGKVLSREECVKLLKSKFAVQEKSYITHIFTVSSSSSKKVSS